jgi:predicted DNA-binding transcriptional regulator AlpA
MTNAHTAAQVHVTTKKDVNMSTQSKTLTTAQAAEFLGVSRSYLNQLRCFKPKESPPFAKLGARVVYPVAALEEWLARRTVNIITVKTQK